jgi:transcriptional regulator with XRE-family HTH domain
MTATQFKKWQKRMGWSAAEAARELRCSTRQVSYYRNGKTAVTPQLQLLCELVADRHAAQLQQEMDQRLTGSAK